VASSPHKSDQCNTNYQRKTKEDHVDRHGVIVEGFVCCGIKCGLREVKEAGETNDQAIDFAKGGETEDFGGVVAVRKLAMDLGERDW
jgi:hypothetical protein